MTVKPIWTYNVVSTCWILIVFSSCIRNTNYSITTTVRLITPMNTVLYTITQLLYGDTLTAAWAQEPLVVKITFDYVVWKYSLVQSGLIVMSGSSLMNNWRYGWDSLHVYYIPRNFKPHPTSPRRNSWIYPYMFIKSQKHIGLDLPLVIFLWR